MYIFEYSTEYGYYRIRRKFCKIEKQNWKSNMYATILNVQRWVSGTNSVKLQEQWSCNNTQQTKKQTSVYSKFVDPMPIYPIEIFDDMVMHLRVSHTVTHTQLIYKLVKRFCYKFRIITYANVWSRLIVYQFIYYLSAALSNSMNKGSFHDNRKSMAVIKRTRFVAV